MMKKSGNSAQTVL